MDSLRGTWEAGKDRLGTREDGKDQDYWDRLGGTREAPGRHQGSRKGLLGQPGRHQGGTWEAGKDQLDSLGSTREAGKDHLDSLGGAREAPGRQERTNWTACEAPGRQERHWELFAFKPCPFPKWGLGL